MKKNIKQDLEKLSQAFFKNLLGPPEEEYIGLGAKRPFGNSSIDVDILEIIDAPTLGIEENTYSEEQYEYANELYALLVPYLQRKYITDKNWLSENRELQKQLEENAVWLKEKVEELEEAQEDLDNLKSSTSSKASLTQNLNKTFTWDELFE